jgi:hypothetical protein
MHCRWRQPPGELRHSGSFGLRQIGEKPLDGRRMSVATPAARAEPDRGSIALAAMKISCFLGRHWPAAALAPRAYNHDASTCVDCASPMRRRADGSWTRARLNALA